MTILYYQYFQIASVLSGLLFFRRLRDQHLLYFLLLCTIGTVVDISSSWVKDAGYPSNHFVLNYYPMLSISVVFIAYYRHLQLSTPNGIIYKLVAVVATAAGILNYFFWEGMMKMNNFSHIFYHFFCILLSCLLLFKMAMREDYFTFTSESLFWIAGGMLIFSLGALVVMGMSQFIRINHLTIRNKALYNIIMPMLNVIFYSSFTYAFILCRLKRKSYSPLLS